jgi:hypothetical protein
MLVVTEVSCLLGDRLGHVAERTFARSLRDGELLVEPVEPHDWARITELSTSIAISRSELSTLLSWPHANGLAPSTLPRSIAVTSPSYVLATAPR